MKHVPNHDKVPFNQMTPEERSAIVEAKLIGETQWFASGEWIDTESDGITFYFTYRTKPCQLIIPWEHIKPEYKWAAIDENGSVFVYTDEPSKADDDWLIRNGNEKSHAESVCMLNIDTTEIDWRDSLVQRPEGV